LYVSWIYKISKKIFVAYFKSLSRTREIKSRIAMTKAAFSKKKTFYQQIGLKFEEETNKMLRLEHGFVWC